MATLLRLAILALGVTLSAKMVPGISCDDGSTLVAVVTLLTLFNWILKPLLVVFTLPFIVATLGLGLVLINAVLFLLVGRLVAGFHVAGFGTAIVGSVVVSLTSFLVSALIRRSRAGEGRTRPARRNPDKDSIDI
jgi:putative membrane protein